MHSIQVNSGSSHCTACTSSQMSARPSSQVSTASNSSPQPESALISSMIRQFCQQLPSGSPVEAGQEFESSQNATQRALDSSPASSSWSLQPVKRVSPKKQSKKV